MIEAEKMQKQMQNICKRKRGTENLFIEFSSKNFEQTNLQTVIEFTLPQE